MGKNSIGAALRRIRERLGVSIVSVARRGGISDAMLSRIERGERLSPHFTTVAKIAKVLGVSLDEVAEEAGIPIARPHNLSAVSSGLEIRRSQGVETAVKHMQRALDALEKVRD